MWTQRGGVTHLFIWARIVQEVRIAGAAVLGFALQVLLLGGIGRVGLFRIGGWCGQEELRGTAKAALPSSGRNIRFFIEKMVSMICCCWPAMTPTAP